MPFITGKSVHKRLNHSRKNSSNELKVVDARFLFQFGNDNNYLRAVRLVGYFWVIYGRNMSNVRYQPYTYIIELVVINIFWGNIFFIVFQYSFINSI